MLHLMWSGPTELTVPMAIVGFIICAALAWGVVLGGLSLLKFLIGR